MRRVLITRPEPGASRTAQKLAELGFEPVLLPLSETRPLPVNGNAVPIDAAAVAVTSANAIRHAAPELLSALSSLPCHAVGTKTTQAARSAGFSSVREGPGEALALADQIAASFSGSLVYLCGRVRLIGFEDRLAGSGVRVHPLESYDTVSLEYSDEAVSVHLADRPVDAVLLYSAKAAHAFGALAERSGTRHLFEGAGLFVLSQRIASALGQYGCAAASVAAQPTEQALLTLLDARR
jgi:uroporphyrinogen-III synthase